MFEEFQRRKNIKELDEEFKNFSSIKEQLLIEKVEEYVNCLEEKIKNLEEVFYKKVKKDGKNYPEIFNGWNVIKIFLFWENNDKIFLIN